MPAQRASARSPGRSLRKQDARNMPPWSKEPLAVQGVRTRLVPQNDNPARLPSLPEAGLLACQLGRVFTAPCLRPVRCQMDRPLCGGSSFRSSDSRGACSCHVQARAVDRSARTVTTQASVFLRCRFKSPRGSDSSIFWLPRFCSFVSTHRSRRQQDRLTPKLHCLPHCNLLPHSLCVWIPLLQKTEAKSPLLFFCRTA